MPSSIDKTGHGLSQAAKEPLQADQIQELPPTPDPHPAEPETSAEKSRGSQASSSPPQAPYSLFTTSQRRLVVCILILTMLASPLTATIYLPLLPILADHFHVSLQAINFTLTIYIVFQAISPLLFATASDTYGRRPIYLLTFSIYSLASLGLVLNRTSYAGLLVLRAMQSLGASAVLAIAYGVIADLCVPSERGAMQGPAMGAANLAVCIGPVVGGWTAQASGSYEWVFWCLVIYGCLVVLTVGFGLPETARNVVGNGETKTGCWEKTWWDLLIVWRKNRTRARDSTDANVDEEKPDPTDGAQDQSSPSHINTPFKIPNPWAAVRIIFWKDTALVLWMAGSPYAIWYCVQASIPPVYKDIYGFNDFQVGLSYLTGGFGTVLGGYANCKLMDWNYRVTARHIGHTIDKLHGDDLNNFPIERARARGSWYMLSIYLCALAGYGWAIKFHVHQTFNALLVDVFPTSPSTAAAAGSITSCALSAVAVASLQLMVKGMGRGWYFSLLSLLSGGGGCFTNWLVITRGIAWRQRRLGVS
ncbi:MAG: hypothetical protein Q9168_004489 [Polycauliona sp. 1 TL-2023]